MVPNLLAAVFKKQEISQQVVTVTRMQDLASVFTKISGGDTPGPSEREGTTHSRSKHPIRLLAERVAQAPWCWNPNLGPRQLFSRVCAPEFGFPFGSLPKSHIKRPLGQVTASTILNLLTYFRLHIERVGVFISRLLVCSTAIFE